MLPMQTNKRRTGSGAWFAALELLTRDNVRDNARRASCHPHGGPSYTAAPRGEDDMCEPSTPPCGPPLDGGVGPPPAAVGALLGGLSCAPATGSTRSVTRADHPRFGRRSGPTTGSCPGVCSRKRSPEAPRGRQAQTRELADPPARTSRCSPRHQNRTGAAQGIRGCTTRRTETQRWRTERNGQRRRRRPWRVGDATPHRDASRCGLNTAVREFLTGRVTGARHDAPRRAEAVGASADVGEHLVGDGSVPSRSQGATTRENLERRRRPSGGAASGLEDSLPGRCRPANALRGRPA
jgi:hypothetical protein